MFRVIKDRSLIVDKKFVDKASRAIAANAGFTPVDTTNCYQDLSLYEIADIAMTRSLLDVSSFPDKKAVWPERGQLQILLKFYRMYLMRLLLVIGILIAYHSPVSRNQSRHYQSWNKFCPLQL